MTKNANYRINVALGVQVKSALRRLDVGMAKSFILWKFWRIPLYQVKGVIAAAKSDKYLTTVQ